MGTGRGRTQVVAPTGRVYRVGPGAPVGVRGRGLFSISVDDLNGTVYREPVADAYHLRLRELQTSIEGGTWTPPEASRKVIALRAKAEARPKWHEEHRRHPVREGSVVAARMAIIAMVFAAISLIGSATASSLIHAAWLVTAWSSMWFVLTILAIRQRPQH
jgi:hypothetical protein